MKHLVVALLVVYGTCCGSIPAREPETGLTVECGAPLCPSYEDVTRALHRFALRMEPEFDAEERLLVRWFPEDHVFYINGDNKQIIGLTHNPYALSTTSFPVLYHELLHVHLWRTVDDPDRNHAEPPGAWEADDESRIKGMGTGP